MQEIDLATQTMFAELLQRSLDAEFDAEFRENGTFVRKRSKGRLYWHYQWREGEKTRNKYVGPVTDPSITDRVKRFATIKTSYKRRKTLVRALTATGLPTPDALSGMIVEAMWKAGVFRLRGVLVGTLAFQTYAAALGVRLDPRPLMTQDADFAHRPEPSPVAAQERLKAGRDPAAQRSGDSARMTGCSFFAPPLSDALKCRPVLRQAQ